MMEVGRRFGITTSTARRMIIGVGAFKDYPNLHEGRSHKNRRLNYKDEEEIRRLYATGKYRKVDIVNMYGVDFSVITRLLRYGYTYKRPKPADEQPLLSSMGKQVFAKEAEAMRQDYRDGMTPKEIAEKYELSIVTIRRILGGKVGDLTDIRRRPIRKRGRKPKTRYYGQGVKNRMAKLDEEAVKFIRESLDTGEYSQNELAEMFGVSSPVVYYAGKGVTWQHVQV